MPEITLSLPAALGLLTLFLAIGAVLVYVALQQTTPVMADATTNRQLSHPPKQQR